MRIPSVVRRFPRPGLLVWPAAIAILAAALLLVPPRRGAAYVEDPAPGHTGGFGEPTCQACHFGEAVNDPAGELRVEGVPERTAPGAVHRLTVVLERPDLVRGGFQLGARFADGEHAGETAGGLASPDERSRVTRVEASGTAYAHHSPQGTRAPSPGALRWELEWTAPKERSGRVLVHVAANASNDDDSAFGDHVYFAEVETEVIPAASPTSRLPETSGPVVRRGIDSLHDDPLAPFGAAHRRR